jgi:hypothetical protein
VELTLGKQAELVPDLAGPTVYGAADLNRGRLQARGKQESDPIGTAGGMHPRISIEPVDKIDQRLAVNRQERPHRRSGRCAPDSGTGLRPHASDHSSRRTVRSDDGTRLEPDIVPPNPAV